MKQYDSGCCFRGSSNSTFVRVLFELNTTCNLSCSWCHTKDGKPEMLKTQEVLSTLELLKKWGVKGVIFSGGEPLLRRDIFEIIKKAHDLDLDCDLCTNGTLVTPQIAAQLSEYLSEVSISLDSANPETQDNIRGTKGAFYQAVEGIKYFIHAGVEVHAITMCCNDNYQHVDETISLLESLGVPSVTLLGLIEITRNESSYKFSDESRIDLEKTIDEVRSNHQNIIINTKRIKHLENALYCGAGRTMIGITASGMVCPCILLKNRVNKYSINDLSHMDSIADVLDVLNKNQENYHKQCTNTF